MNKIIILVMFFFTISVVFGVEAKLLPRFQKTGKTVSRPVAASGLVVSARLRADRRALLVTFSNLNKVTALNYSLMYQTNGEDQGVGGTVDISSGNSISRELVFGTASNGVYRYHENLTNMKLEITSSLPSGKQTLKRFRVRI